MELHDDENQEEVPDLPDQAADAAVAGDHAAVPANLEVFMIRAQEGMNFEVFWRWVQIARGVEPLSTLEFQYEDSEYVPEPQDQATRREKTNLNTSRISPQYLGLTRRMKERDHHRVLQDEFEEEKAAVEAIDVSEAPNLVEGIRAKITEAATNLPRPRTLKQTMREEAREDSAATIQLGGPVAESSIAPGEMDAGFPNVTRKIERARLVEQEPVAGGTEAEIIIEEESAAGSEQVAGGPKDLEVGEKMTPGGKNPKKLVGYSDSEEETAPMEDVDAGNGGNAASNDQGVTMVARTGGDVIDVETDSSDDEEGAGPRNPFYRIWVKQRGIVFESSS